jgi:hypothetical protein
MPRSLGLTIIAIYLAGFALAPLFRPTGLPVPATPAELALLMLGGLTLVAAGFAAVLVWRQSMRATTATSAWAVLALSHFLLSETNPQANVPWHIYAVMLLTLLAFCTVIVLQVRSRTPRFVPRSRA